MKRFCSGNQHEGLYPWMQPESQEFQTWVWIGEGLPIEYPEEGKVMLPCCCFVPRLSGWSASEILCELVLRYLILSTSWII